VSESGLSPKAWESFEQEVFDHVKNCVEFYGSAMNPRIAKFHRKKAYPSKDVVVEAWEADAKEPSMRWILECKDYPDRNVSVDEVEEFSAKLEQIGPMNVRGTIVTRHGFQEAAYNYAVSRKISLYVLQRELVRVTQFDHRCRTIDRLTLPCPHGVMPSGHRVEDIGGWNLEMLVQVELRSAGLIS